MGVGVVVGFCFYVHVYGVAPWILNQEPYVIKLMYIVSLDISYDFDLLVKSRKI